MKDEKTATLRHDLKNDLSVILGFTGVLKAKLQLKKESDQGTFEALDIIEARVQKMVDTINTNLH